MHCRRANRRLASKFAASLTSTDRDSICDATEAAVRLDEEIEPMTDEDRREAFVRRGRLALKACYAMRRRGREQ
jgi:hypothetical protein